MFDNSGWPLLWTSQTRFCTPKHSILVSFLSLFLVICGWLFQLWKSRCNQRSHTTPKSNEQRYFHASKLARNHFVCFAHKFFYTTFKWIWILEWCEILNMFVFNRLWLLFSMHEIGIHNWICRSVHGEKIIKIKHTENKHRTYQEYTKYTQWTEKLLYVSNSDDRSTLSAEWKSVFTMFIGAAQSFISPDPWNRYLFRILSYALFMAFGVFGCLACTANDVSLVWMTVRLTQTQHSLYGRYGDEFNAI